MQYSPDILFGRCSKLSTKPDLSIIDVDTEQAGTGAGRDTDRVTDPEIF